MDQPSALPLRIGAWCVSPASGQISRDTEVVRVEARTMRLLLCLAERAGQVVSIEDLLNLVWSGVIVTPDSVYPANNYQAAAAAGVPQRSVAVLPFLDLTTEAMNEEYFADGMTEELIDKLSKIPGLRVPAPTSSFYFKGKRIPLADIAKSLAVAYILDGSVRKSDATLRVAVRLTRAADGYVVWTETYDRPLGDKLEVQDDIAGEVAKALRTSII
jgi:TolB-like protein